MSVQTDHFYVSVLIFCQNQQNVRIHSRMPWERLV